MSTKPADSLRASTELLVAIADIIVYVELELTASCDDDLLAAVRDIGGKVAGLQTAVKGRLENNFR